MKHGSGKNHNSENEDILYMREALRLASKARGLTSPNPIVGALIVRDGRIIGKGFHARAGAPHAEVIALDEAGDNSKGATLYVTLEPCSHFGKTPPCTKKIIGHGIANVVIAVEDPNPLVAGNGRKELEKAGIAVRSGVLEETAKKQNEVFFKYITKGLPLVTIKGAVTADGKTASVTGNSKWISGESSRKHVHLLRFFHDGIMVGVNTVLKDDPDLTCRLEKKAAKRITKIIVDSTGKTPPSSNIFKSIDNSASGQHGYSYSIIIAATDSISANRIKEYESLGATVLVTTETGGRVRLLPLFQALAKLGITSVLVEGGSELSASIIEEGLADKLVVFIAPKIIGGRTAPTLVGGNGIEKMDNSIDLSLSGIKRFDDDIMLEYDFVHSYDARAGN